MRKAFLVLTLLGATCLTHAANVQPFSDNENITVELSKLNYNRLFIANDSIKKATFPKDDLVIKYETDGSVFIDIVNTEPFTVFLKTGNGHHFSMTVKPADMLGQTVQLVPKTPTIQARQFEKKSTYEEVVTHLIQAMMNHQTPPGYGVKSVASSYRVFNKDLSVQVAKQYIGDAYLGEIITVYNRSKTPVTLDEAWFKTNDTKAIALSNPTVAAKHSETLFIVREKAHA